MIASTARQRLRARLEIVCQEIGADLLRQLTLVGGSAQAVLPLTVPARPTKDVDFVLLTIAPLDWHRFLHGLESRGFRASREEGAPICRYEKNVGSMNLVVDIMPTDDRLGFTNRWYPDVHAHRAETDIPGLYVVTPLLYLLTKIEAFNSRGAKDPVSSSDLEDIVALCRGIPDLLDEVERGSDASHAAARGFLSAFASRPDAANLVRSHTEGDSAAQEEAVGLLARFASAGLPTAKT